MTSARVFALLLVLLFASHLQTACGGDAPAAAATPPPAAANQPASNTPPAAANALPGDPKAAILQALRAQLTAGPYRSTTTITMEDGAQTMVGEVAPPDRMHVEMDLGGIKTEMIYIGDKVWSKQGDDAWTESDRMGGLGGALLDESMIADTERTIIEAALVGPEQVGGVDAVAYTFTTDMSKSEVMPIESIVQTKVWIDPTTGLIVRQEVTDSLSDTPSTTVQEIEYDSSITIEPPVQ